MLSMSKYVAVNYLFAWQGKIILPKHMFKFCHVRENLYFCTLYCKIQLC